MASIDDLLKKQRLEQERDAVRRALSIEKEEKEQKDIKEIEALQRVLAKIELEIENWSPNFAEAPKTPPTPVLSNSSYHEPMPSARVKYRSSWNEGAPSSRRRR
ncbi:MAG: hypothetical protein A2758_02615 [Candidatus Zambryskibacteria bacterium RIFCSPHIGHO2_01_FULL_49_18]|uniref:Uncharacterized protein n=2 Tax=Candidatus Zambryskiibacteriota TaxID=1817925 RepID=A0A1G2T2U1_9BACT|nr:MAG: hypothetical protein A2758_02615 [Candidatus Zambryskibacteria bacterium RIFCSPHIGHO2_01_FULL_49_18]OHB04970.1 MAG: hypothetical protein A3A26_00110 [Candidatus Zambryskibacteria bacterium RIFCSPLOWO2_01_FULL_47_14]